MIFNVLRVYRNAEIIGKKEEGADLDIVENMFILFMDAPDNSLSGLSEVVCLLKSLLAAKLALNPFLNFSLELLCC